MKRESHNYVQYVKLLNHHHLTSIGVSIFISATVQNYQNSNPYIVELSSEVIVYTPKEKLI